MIIVMCTKYFGLSDDTSKTSTKYALLHIVGIIYYIFLGDIEKKKSPENNQRDRHSPRLECVPLQIHTLFFNHLG